MKPAEIMRELAGLGKDSLKKRYTGNGAREPLFGVATGAMKPLHTETLAIAKSVDDLSLAYDDTKCFSGIARAINVRC